MASFIAYKQGFDEQHVNSASSEPRISKRMARLAKKQKVVYDDAEAGRLMFRYPMEEFAQVLQCHVLQTCICLKQSLFCMQDAISISVGDVRRLTEGEFLNDNIIDLQIKRIVLGAKQRDPSPQPNEAATTVGGHNASPIYAFSSMFYTKLTEIAGADSALIHSMVKRWTKNVDIFSKDFIFIPINIGAHWSLVCVVRPGALINAEERANEVFPLFVLF